MAGRLGRDTDPHKLLEDPVIADIAKKHRQSPAQVSVSEHTVSVCVYSMSMVTEVFSQVLLRYHVQQGVSVIPKSDKPHHILENTKVWCWLFFVFVSHTHCSHQSYLFAFGKMENFRYDSTELHVPIKTSFHKTSTTCLLWCRFSEQTSRG